MPRRLTWLDRLRIERVIWTVDVLVAELPGRSRRTILRDLRANLRAAAAEVGTTEAVLGLGSLRRLSAGYLEAEYGPDQPRPRWWRGAFWAIAIWVVILSVTIVQSTAFVDGVRAVDPHAGGTYTWHPLAPGLPSGEVTLGDQGRTAGISFPLGMLAYPLAALLLGARSWRALRRWRRPWSL
ncbi:MAG: hypothetical protein J2P28_14395 [Actinobacteria bacterium]|nr:hypothetical protein [Actinomycetota bacterium]